MSKGLLEHITFEMREPMGYHHGSLSARLTIGAEVSISREVWNGAFLALEKERMTQEILHTLYGHLQQPLMNLRSKIYEMRRSEPFSSKPFYDAQDAWTELANLIREGQ